MKSSFNYCREFCIFEEEDKGFNICGELSGYVKFEINNSLVNISIVVYNIKSNLSYQVYMIKRSGQEVKSRNIGDLFIKNNVASLSYKISLCDKDVLNFSAIVVVNVDGDGNFFAPVVAYRRERIMWRDHIAKMLQKNLPKKQSNMCALSNVCPMQSVMPKKIMSSNWPMVKIPFNKDIFKRQVNINFAKCNPFLNSRKDYMWWSVTDVDKLYYFLKLFNIDIRDKIFTRSENMILGMYENEKRTYIVLGFLLDGTPDKRYDKIAKVSDLNVRYGLIFINPYIA